MHRRPSAFYAATGRAPRVADFVGRRDGRPTAPSIRRVFGSWNAALFAAGISVNRASGAGVRRHWSDEEILEAIREAARQGEATSDPFSTGRRLPWIGPIELHFGSWRVAKRLPMCSLS